jgi:hypothetical protein
MNDGNRTSSGYLLFIPKDHRQGLVSVPSPGMRPIGITPSRRIDIAKTEETRGVYPIGMQDSWCLKNSSQWSTELAHANGTVC